MEFRLYIFLSSFLLLIACQNGVIRDFRGDLSTIPPSETVENKIENALQPLPPNQTENYDVVSEDATLLETQTDGQFFVQAEKGDTPRKIAQRHDIEPETFAKYNNVILDDELDEGALLIIPPEDQNAPSKSTANLIALSQNALSQSKRDKQHVQNAQNDLSVTALTHRVQAGETAHSIAKSYNVSTKSLAEWNALGIDLEVRVGQSLLIPNDFGNNPNNDAGLSIKSPTSRDQIPIKRPTITARAKDGSNDTGMHLHMPAKGFIKTRFRKNISDGLDIAVTLGAPVYAVADGTVTNITRDTQGIGVIVISHDNDLLTIYEYVDDIQIPEGTDVSAGDKIAYILSPSPGHLHFELRQGFDPIDPEPFF